MSGKLWNTQRELALRVSRNLRIVFDCDFSVQRRPIDERRETRIRDRPSSESDFAKVSWRSVIKYRT